LPSKRRLENRTPPDADANPLAGVRYELLCDLNDVTQEQEQKARESLAVHPSTLQLILEVKKFARVLAGTCRSHVARCAQIHANCNESEPARAAIKTLGLVLCEHLELPRETSLLMSALMTEIWPELNGVSRFVLDVADAPVEPDDFSRRQLRLPRWGWKGRGVFSRLGRTESDRPGPEENDPFLSVEETQRLLRDLEESFRNHLCNRWLTVFATALSAVASLASRAERAKEAEKLQPILETTVDAQDGDGAPQSKRAHVELGGWAEQRLEEMRNFVSILRGGKSPESLRPQFVTLFAEVIDLLQKPRRERLFEEARRRHMRVPDLMSWIADVKELSATTLADYRKTYRHEMGTARKRR
jgi:hypothetical protein